MTTARGPYIASGKVPFLTAVTTGDACQKRETVQKGLSAGRIYGLWICPKSPFSKGNDDHQNQFPQIHHLSPAAIPTEYLPQTKPQTVQNNQPGLPEMSPKTSAPFKNRPYSLGLPRLEQCSLKVASGRSQGAVDLPWISAYNSWDRISFLLKSLCYSPVTPFWYLNNIVPNQCSAPRWLFLWQNF